MTATASSPEPRPAWIPCPDCDGYFCTIHGKHVADCECPEIDEWAIDPYTQGGPQ
jgi:hypothetical protein